MKKIEALTTDWKTSRRGKPAVAAPPKPAADGEDRHRPDRGAGARVHRAPRHHAQQPGLLQAAGDGQRARHRRRVHRPALRAPARPAGAGVHRERAASPAPPAKQPGMFTGYIGTFPDKFTWVRDGFLKEVEPHPRRAADGSRKWTTRRSTCSAACRSASRRSPAVAGRVARGRTVRAWVRLPGEVPQGGGGGDRRRTCRRWRRSTSTRSG